MIMSLRKAYAVVTDKTKVEEIRECFGSKAEALEEAEKKTANTGTKYRVLTLEFKHD
jgi:hypothetical protein